MIAEFKDKCIALKEGLVRQKRGISEPEWFAQLRSIKMNKFLKQDLPFSEFADLLKFSFRHQGKTEIGLPKYDKKNFVQYLLRDRVYVLAFVDGRYVPDLFPQERLPEGVVLTSINLAWRDFPDLLAAYLKREYSYEDLPASANLDLALATDGIFLYVPENVILSKPCYLLFITNSHVKENFCNLNNLIIAEKNSNFSILQEHMNFSEESYFDNVYTQIYAHESAQINYYKLQNESKFAFHLANLRIAQESYSFFHTFHLGLGNFFASDSIQIALSGKDARCDLQGLTLLAGSQSNIRNVQIDHLAPQSFSRELYKSVLNDKASGAFRGKIKVHEGAQKSHALLKNQNLILSKNATAKTLPELEIYADDVKCNHGATIGQLDQKALFYLRSRGIREKDAKHILIRAFMQDVIDKIEDSRVKGYCNAKFDFLTTSSD